MEIIGKKLMVTFGMAKAILHFESDTALTFTILEKESNVVDITETVIIRLTEIRPQIYLVTWQEQSSTTVTQVHDYDQGIIYSNWTSPTGEFTNMKGTIKAV